MDFATAHHRKQQARQVYTPIEFPKYVTVNGKPELALNAEHEMELLTKPSDAEPEVENLLSAPEKRDHTTPRLMRSKGA